MHNITGIVDAMARFVGKESALRDVTHTLKTAVQQVRAPVVGAMHITCSDESELENINDFHKTFAQALLPRLKFAQRAQFSSSNLGGRYEWQSLQIAEQHYATPESHETGKILTVKISAHAAEHFDTDKRSRGGNHRDRSFGEMLRYDVLSPCCGALAALMQGSSAPFAKDLREKFLSEGKDRIELLSQVPIEHRALAAAAVSARLQARSAAVEAQDYQPASPTVYVILPCVTINKPGMDSKLLVGIYVIDQRPKNRGGTGLQLYRGLGDDPSMLRIEDFNQQLRVTDTSGNMDQTRNVRDHRLLIREAAAKTMARLPRSEKIEALLTQAKQGAGDANTHKLVSKALLIALAELSPVTAAAILFGQGLGGIYHAYKAHQMVNDVSNSEDAKAILAELQHKIDHLPPEEAQKITQALASAYEQG